jgi:hypothetical protein
MRDLDLLLSVANNIGGKTLCPFGDAEIAPVVSTIQHFRTSSSTTSARAAASCRRPTGRPASSWRRTEPRPSPGSSQMDLIFVAQIVVVLFTFFMALNSAAVNVLLERKVAGWLQDRLGPYRVGPWGTLQPVADIIKLLMKEETAAQGGRRAALLGRADPLGHRGLRRLRRRAVRGPETTFFGLLDEPIKLQAPTSTSACSCSSPSPRWASTASCSPAGAPTASTRCSAACARRRR